MLDAGAIKRSLKGGGLRCTPQRYAVMAFLMEYHGHPTAAVTWRTWLGSMCPGLLLAHSANAFFANASSFSVDSARNALRGALLASCREGSSKFVMRFSPSF